MNLPVTGKITQYFDTPVDYIAGRDYHEAIDIVTNGSQDIHATFDGKITTSIDRYDENTKTGYGNRIYLMSTNGSVVDSFAHCEQGSLLPVGTVVSKGNVIARTGRTGYRYPTSIYHTHWEREHKGKRVDPLDESTLPNELTNDDMTAEEKKMLEDHDKAIAELFRSKERLENVEGDSKLVQAVRKLQALKFGKSKLKEFLSRKKK